MTISKQKIIYIGTAFFIVISVFLWFKRGIVSPKTAEQVYSEKKLSNVEILETLDLGSDTPRFKLNLQTPPMHEDSMDHQMTVDSFTSTPKTLILRDKKTNEKKKELPLVYSTYQGECLMHNQMPDMVKKWETDWFTLTEFQTVTATYDSKLTDTYSVEILYEDQGSTNIYSSSHSISNVCYQTSKTVPLTPSPDDYIPSD
jgi:hypothetical protein